MNSVERKKLNQTMREVFGIERLRPGQREIIEAVLEGEDILALMPTGAGKSLCYQLPALHLEGMTIVVSPLISLMKDQADKLEEKGLDVANLNSSLSASEQKESLEEVEHERSREKGSISSSLTKRIVSPPGDTIFVPPFWIFEKRSAYLAIRPFSL
jgi:ATP-dependent DNA helicase RecQ